METKHKGIGEQFSDPIFFIDVKINNLKDIIQNINITNDKKYFGVIFYISSPKLKQIHSNILKKKIYSTFAKKAKIYNDILGIDRIKKDYFINQKIKETKDEIKNLFRGIEINIKTEISYSEEDFINSKKNIYNLNENMEKNICYTCVMCQNLSINHVCIIMHDRDGQCGCMNYNDAKLMYELIPFGPCQKIQLKEPIDLNKGEWQEINEAVKKLTYGHIKKIYLRSTLQYPAPCSPLSQTISIYGGEGEYIYILDRQNKKFNPIGISFDEALKMTAGGVQFEGITAQARNTIFEKTFLLENGGLKNSIYCGIKKG